MSNTVRVGVVGTSWYPDWMHLPALKSHAQAQTVAICGRNRARAEELAQKYTIPQVFTSYGEMFQQANLDAVVIAVPDDLHYPVTMAALEAGLHVLCEKPMAFTLQQAREMLAKAEQKQVKHMVYFTWRWAPYFRYMVQLVRDGYIGKCYDAHFHYLGGYARDAYYQWKWDRQRGLGILGDLGSHLIDIARLTLGDISKVQAHLSAHVQRPDLDRDAAEQANDSAMVALRFANGAVGSLYASAVSHVGNHEQEMHVTLYGDEGTLEVYADGSTHWLRGVRNADTVWQTLPIPDAIYGDCDRTASTWVQIMQIFTRQSVGTRLFIDAIANHSAIDADFHAGAQAQAVMDAAFASHASGCWAEVPQC